jgi:hypothetical protein
VVSFSGVSAIDNVNGALTPSCEPLSSSSFQLGTTEVTCSATDAAGNLGENSFAVIVVDTTPPDIVLPDDITVNATSPAGASVSYDVSATDSVDPTVTIECTHASGSLFPVGTTEVSCTATDDSDNQDGDAFFVTVKAAVPPVVTVPANMTVEATGPGGALVTFVATATDDLDGPLIPECTRRSGIDWFPLGVTAVDCTATDSSGNSTTESFTVTVVDTTPPKLTLPATITRAATSSTGVLVSYTASASDLVDGSVTPICTPLSGSLFGPGANTVSCYAIDMRNNRSADEMFQINVIYGWSGFLQPINGDGSSIFKLGRTVPVKFRLSGASAGIGDAVATLSIAKVSGSVTGTSMEAVSTAATDSGNTFRYDPAADQYIFNLATKTLTPGTWALSVDLGDGVPHTVQISLR